MRLALVSGHSFPAGGAAVTRILAFAEAWVDAGHEVVIVLVTQPLAENATPPGVDAADRWRWVSIATATGRLPGGWRVDVGTRLGATLACLHHEAHLDAVWVVDRVPWTLHVCRRTGHRLRVPVVHELTEFLEVTDAGHLRAAVERRRMVAELRRLDGLLVISRALGAFADEVGIRHVLLTGPMVHLEDRSPPPADADEGDGDGDGDGLVVRIGYAGTISQAKDGVLDLVSAVAMLHAERPELRVELTVLGSGPDEQAVRDRAEALGIADLVELPGRLTPTALAEALTRFRVLTLPRPDSRQALGGFPTKLGLYLLSGRPVVATRTGDVDYYLEDGVNAYLVPSDDPAAFARALATVVDDPAGAEEVGQQGRQACADGRFAASRRVQEITPFLRTAAEARAASSSPEPQAPDAGRDA
ncbi:glycosyltransferase family 4 protein [uncultured Friedmanniella sp.]|uniref:glycosyltransferase family 4 protein n=1 Tax=uncultured Friedmanniella sp. TaxID=335381 RepID=UPI0035CAA26B